MSFGLGPASAMKPEVFQDVFYPESDGQPVGETDLHIDWIFRLRDMLKWRYREQLVYVAADLLLYYQEGVLGKFVVPDVFVVKNIPTDFRRVYKLWEEGQAPHFVMEVTSASSRYEDEMDKPKRYAEIGVREYFLYDPTSDYLRPPLIGFRLHDGEHVRIEPDGQGRLLSEELRLHLSLDGSDLVLRDADSGHLLLTAAEARWKEADEAKLAADEAKLAADEAQREAQQAEAEVQRLRDLLRQHGIEE